MTTKLTLILPRDGRTDWLLRIGEVLHICGLRPISLAWADTVEGADAHVWIAVNEAPARTTLLTALLRTLPGAHVEMASDESTRATGSAS